MNYPAEMFEFIVVDNHSDPPLAARPDIRIPSFAQVIREEEPGIVWARLCGIQKATGDYLVFVDDDNLLDENYLSEVNFLYEKNPQVGVWCGDIELIFENTPDPWTKPFWRYLAYRPVKRESWSNMFLLAPLPCGAGMSVRKDVAIEYLNLQRSVPSDQKLGRVGNKLMAGDDTEIGLVACQMGLGVGESPRLKVKHLISPGRLDRKYLERITKSVAYSHEWLHLKWGLKNLGTREIFLKKWLRRMFGILFMNPEMKFERCRLLGKRAARNDFRKKFFGKSELG